MGTINDVGKIVELAHARGALAYIHAVHYTPHGPIDVRLLTAISWSVPATNSSDRTWGSCTESASICSACGLKLRANSEAVPFRWEWGTLNHECIAGITACVDYLADIGRTLCNTETRRDALLAAYAAIQQHERALAEV